MSSNPTSGSRWFEAPLLMVSLVSSVSFGGLFVALPYRIGDLGGDAGDVGLIGAIYTGCYAGAMLAGQRWLRRIPPRYLTLAGNLLLALGTAAMGMIGSIPALCVIAGLCGAATSWHWPPVMGMISSGREGAALNRRLGRFSASWSGGLVIGPLVGGWLYDLDSALPFLIGGGLHLICVGLVWSIRLNEGADAKDDGAAIERPLSTEPDLQPADPRAPAFRNMARVGLVCSYMAVGVLRNQLPVFAETELHIGASRFGLIGALFSLSHMAGFALLGYTLTWHYRRWLMWAVQAGLGLCLLLAWSATGMAWLIVCVLLSGLGISLLYASHLYYGVSGGKHRTTLMSVHETLLSVGFLIGALGGGMLARLVGIRFPYTFFCVILLVGVFFQMAIFKRFQRGRDGIDRSYCAVP